VWDELVVHAVRGNYASWGSDSASDRAWAGRTGAHWARMARLGLKWPQASPANYGIEANQSAQTEFCVRELAVGVLESDSKDDGDQLSVRDAGVCALES
jgi:hypothetical protein